MSNNDDNGAPPSPSARRASTAGQRLSEFFGRSPTSTATSTTTSAFPGPITAAAHQQRRLSIASIGLGASPTPNSPFTPHARQDSFSSNGSAQNDSAIDDSGDAAPPFASSPTFRRMSFGSRAMSQQMSGGITNGRSQSVSSASPSTTPPSSTKPRNIPARLEEESNDGDEGGDSQASPALSPSTLSNVFNRRTGESNGFSWSNEMRNRAQRSASITSPISGGFSAARFPPKAASVSTAPAPPPVAAPPVKQQTAPDHFQERILKGDFYMD